MCYFLIIHKRVLLCPCSIFRMFSADRKRVETALENCNLPSGRVRPQNTDALSFLNLCVLSFTLSSVPFSVTPFSCLSHQALSSSLSIHPCIHPSCHSAHSLFPWNSNWLLLCSFIWSVIFWMSAWLPTQNWFSLCCDETNTVDPVGAIEMTKAVLSLPLFFLDITKGKLPHHALRCKHSTSAANKLWMRAVAKNMPFYADLNTHIQ